LTHNFWGSDPKSTIEAKKVRKQDKIKRRPERGLVKNTVRGRGKNETVCAGGMGP